jgi:hypothetical protein
MNPIWSHALVGVSCLLIGVVIGRLSSSNPSIDSKTTFSLRIGLIILGILSVIGVMIGVLNYSKATDCQTQFNSDYTVALKQRQAAAESDRQGLRQLTSSTIVMLDILLNPKSDIPTRTKAVADWRDAYTTYNEFLKKADETRGQNPLPDRPECADRR